MQAIAYRKLKIYKTVIFNKYMDVCMFTNK